MESRDRRSQKNNPPPPIKKKNANFSDSEPAAWCASLQRGGTWTHLSTLKLSSFGSKPVLSILLNNFLPISSHLDHFLLTDTKPWRRKNGDSHQEGCVLWDVLPLCLFGSSYRPHYLPRLSPVGLWWETPLWQQVTIQYYFFHSTREEMEPL